ncbi:L-cysteine desulfidase family protein [Dysgonomonas massiliensis]|uniref:L-cysteine desulfidase family protein n=1 Tax=Dysgonomonas massiliensis TaxID=2040292 RepID=UPI000C7898D9|nr:L-serine ammonia-lyase, iron-sulfur-dependent, subunit alpha [Dysgonomonas massiliensis]
MIDKAEREQIIALIKREVVPAIGCTEPIAVALCVAKASEILGKLPEKIEVLLSANILKNAMGVGIPGTGMIGLPIAVALGALIGKSEYQLEVLKDATSDDVEKGKQMIDNKIISILLKEDISEKLYIEAKVSNGSDSVKAIISGEHTNFVYLEKNNEILLDKQVSTSSEDPESDTPKLSMRKVYDFAMEAPLEEIEFMLESGQMNKQAALQSLKGYYGHGLGRILSEGTEQKIIGKNTFSSILSYTSAACDARMAGAMIPVMSNSGSGNQGISATVPVVVFAEENNCSREQLIRALTLSNLAVIYIKESLGRLSALCGCVVASTGSSCGITYLMGGEYKEVCFAVKNMIANLTGMICDGAKPSCALKVTSGTSTSLLSAMMAMEQRYVTSVEGIIDDDVDQCILNLTRIGSQGMNETDKLVLDIMTHKCG